MSMHKKNGIVLGLGLALTVAAAPVQGASEVDVEMMDPEVSHHDRESIRKGAEHYAEYCVGCHSLEHLRYTRLAEDVGEDEDWLEEEIMRSGDEEKFDPIVNTMDSEEAEDWFGLVPPDLTLTARQQSEEWIYTYLNTFYVDEDADVGYNNLVQEETSMPHVLQAMQGDQHAERNEEGEVVDLEIPEDAEGRLSEEEYQEMTAQITAFLSYAAEPIRADRERLGVWVILFLIVFTGVFYLLYKEYWRDIKK
ncbi:MAG: cytochrome c1 [Halorhodospira sp.]